MFRPRTIRTGLQLARGLPKRSIQPPIRHASTVRVQRVVIRRPFFSKRKALSFALWGATFYAIWHYLVPTIEIEEDDEGSHDNGGGVEDDEEEDDLEPLFIPLTLAKPLPRRALAPWDEGFEQLREIQAQPEERWGKLRIDLANKIRHDVGDQIGRVRTRNPKFKAGFGEVVPTKGAFYLDITWDLHAPPEYERGGLEVGGDEKFIAWSTRPVSERDYYLLNKIMYPTAVASAFYDTSRFLVKQHWRQFKTFVKESMNSDHSTTERRSLPPAAPPPTPVPIKSQSIQRVITPSSSQAFPSPSPKPPPPPGSNQNEQRVAMPKFTTVSPNSLAHLVFLRTLTRKWGVPPLPKVPGTVHVSGLVEVMGTRGRITMDVMAVYDLKTNKWLGIRGFLRKEVDYCFRPEDNK